MSLRVIPDVEQHVGLYHVGDVQLALCIVPKIEGVAVYAITIGWVAPLLPASAPFGCDLTPWATRIAAAV